MLEVKMLRKTLGEKLAVDRVSFTAETGEFVSLLGPSGCGKTTTLRMIAGLIAPDSGEINVNDKSLFSAVKHLNVPAEKREIGMVFQSYAIWPHLTVEKNVSYPLELRKVSRSEIQDRVSWVLDLVKLSDLRHRFPGELSGGQQQRVALARALVYSPALLLLDEPLANLDARVRDSVRFEIRSLQQKAKITTIYVTHDQNEAMVLSDKVIVLNKGIVVQEGGPADIYRDPTSPFVAEFVGNSNIFPGIVESVSGRKISVNFSKDHLIQVESNDSWTKGESVSISVRPEEFFLHPVMPSTGENIWQGKVTDMVFLGNMVMYTVSLGGRHFQIQSDPYFEVKRKSTEIYLSLEPSRARTFKVTSELEKFSIEKVMS